MKQISYEQARAFAIRDKAQLKKEIEYCASDWIAAHARDIAAIELKVTDKTCFGLFPKGWKKAMRSTLLDSAEHNLALRFINRCCRQIDGVLWTGNSEYIDFAEGKKR